jgi:hypothetical protein
MILHLQCLPLPAISAACDPDSARTPFIPPNPIPGHDDRIALALFAGKGWGVGWESRIVACDGPRGAFQRPIRTNRVVIGWMSGGDRPDDHPRTGQDGEDSSIDRR